VRSPDATGFEPADGLSRQAHAPRQIALGEARLDAQPCQLRHPARLGLLEHAFDGLVG